MVILLCFPGGNLRKEYSGKAGLFTLPFLLVKDAAFLGDAGLSVEKGDPRAALATETSVELRSRLYHFAVVLTPELLLRNKRWWGEE